MEQTAQLGLRANTRVRLPLPRFYVEDKISLSDARARVQFKKSMKIIRGRIRPLVTRRIESLNHRGIEPLQERK